ncbi:hypothetical protein X777_05155 [Ooceraea biroi]|uniref:Uncharacterized protein n=1 Tax=Ooceraea biroi TaxID=2015173 RepID=A0A026WH77_OOCBI|nr:hypothetical protein X777_05155 [Ooceraea biroi]
MRYVRQPVRIRVSNVDDRIGSGATRASRHGSLLPTTIRVYNDHVNADMTFEEFATLCRDCWRLRHGFLVIDKDSALRNGRYRRGFNEFAVP